MNYIETSRLVKRERETESWVRSTDDNLIIMRIHELEDQIAGLEAKIEVMENERYPWEEKP